VDKLEWQEILGLVGGFFTTTSLIPQVVRLYRLKSAREISLTFNIFLGVGVSFWMAYGIALSLPAVIIWNAISIVLVGSLLFAKFKYNKQ
jgi:MtN3 and saliva related transmembrane protein